MTVTSYPFDGLATTEGQYSTLFRELGQGVSGDHTGTQLKVSADSTGMNVKVAAGFAIVRGHAIASSGTETLEIEPADSQPRIDTVVLRLNPDTNEIALLVVKGTPAASSPTPPALESTEIGLFDMPIANVAVAANAVTIAATAVTERRTFIGRAVRSWPTSERPTGTERRVPTLGFNTTLGAFEWWNGSAWAGLLSDASDITSGTFSADRIPNLSADKITAGVLNAARVPDLPASKITGAINATTIGGNKITVSSSAPSSPTVNDLWVAL